MGAVDSEKTLMMKHWSAFRHAINVRDPVAISKALLESEGQDHPAINKVREEARKVLKTLRPVLLENRQVKFGNVFPFCPPPP